jgi:GH25 family lysozyme M1 (1,4-beta-N-acetylmuramidase)
VVLSGLAVLTLSLVTATTAHASTTPPPGAGVARGVDVSAYQHAGRAIKWRLLARGGIRFVAIKVSEGTYYTNPYYASDARAAVAAGLSVVPYVFANPSRSPGAATARFGVAAARQARGGGRLPLEVDLENDPYTAGHHGDCYGLGVRQMIAWIAAFIAQTVALTGKPPIIYTAAAWWRECTDGTARFRRDPLWLAAYGTTAPDVPSPWTQWTFWQYSNHTKVPGVGLADVDFYRSTAALPALRGLPVPASPRARRPAPAKRPRRDVRKTWTPPSP